MMKAWWPSIWVATLFVGLGGCATVPNSQVDVSKLSPNDQRLLQQAPFLAREVELTKACLIEKSPTERVTAYETCYATPLRQLALDTAYPNRPAFDVYLKSLETHLQTAGMVESRDEFEREKAKLIDTMIVNTHRSLRNKAGFAGISRVTVKDDVAFRLKQDGVRLLATTSDINSVLGVTEVMTLLQSPVQRKDFDRVRLNNDQQAALSFLFARNAHAFFTYDDLNTINTFKLNHPEFIKKETSAYLGLLGTYEKFVKQRSSRALSAYFKQESTSMEGR